MPETDDRDLLFDRLAVVGKAFASPKRLRILALLAQGERSVEALALEAGLGVTTASAHLQILKLAHLVTTRRERTRVIYRLADDDVAALYATLRRVAATHSPDVDTALRAYLGTGVDDVAQVTRDDLMAMLAAGEVDLVDVRPREEFEAGHIPQARSVPLGDLAAATWPDGVPVVAYCRGAWCVLAHDAVRLLRDRGVAALRLEEGMLEWRGEGRPVVAGAVGA